MVPGLDTNAYKESAKFFESKPSRRTIYKAIKIGS